MKITVYTTEREFDGVCKWCDRAKEALTAAGLPYEAVEIDAFKRPAFYAEHGLEGKARTMPQIFIDGFRIGGHDDLILWLAETSVDQ